MNTQHEAIFRKAMVSNRPQAILEVARAFHVLGDTTRAAVLHERATTWTFGGESYSISDLKDIMAAKDAEMRNLAAKFKTVLAGPNASKVKSTGLADAWQALQDRYNAGRTIAQKAIDSHDYDIVPDFISDATSEYTNLLNMLNQHWRENTWNPGDWSLHDVNDRIKALGATEVYSEPIPQPNAPSALGTLNAATTAIEGAAGGLGTMAGQAATGLTNQLDWQSILKIGAIIGVSVILLPHILSMGPIHALK